MYTVPPPLTDILQTRWFGRFRLGQKNKVSVFRVIDIKTDVEDMDTQVSVVDLVQSSVVNLRFLHRVPKIQAPKLWQ